MTWDSHTYQKHVKATIRAWDRSIARQFSARPRSAAQYNPRILKEEIESLDLACVSGRIGASLEELTHQRTFYYEYGGTQPIGLSNGEFTKYVYVIWQSSGSVHGYPITQRELDILIREATKDK